MDLWIRHYKDGAFAEEHWDNTEDSAKDIVCQWVRDGVVDRIEIRNAKDELVFHYPPIMHGA